ncbi:MAG: putative quinol monooxygenase [Novosphingobium sp.]|uniref:putative quinol monooxygenase n=1 Tax=Novosphingobium sp. TaxID=1874826 RepID=UPI003B9C5382
MIRNALMAAAGVMVLLSGSIANGASAEQQPYVRIAELEIDAHRLGEYKAILAVEQEASVREEPGVIMLHSVALKDRPNQIRLLEVYASRSAYEAHVKSPHFLRYKEATADMVLSLNLIDTDPVLLCAKVPAKDGTFANCE